METIGSGINIRPVVQQRQIDGLARRETKSAVNFRPYIVSNRRAKVTEFFRVFRFEARLGVALGEILVR
jgi:hypothetical protein